MKKLLLIALLLGLIKARTLHAELPPLPVNPGKPPVDLPGTVARPLFAMWHVDASALDVLEISGCADFTLPQDVAGPYETRDIDGVLNYYVPVPVGYAQAFFRVRRVWGNPWVI